MKNETVVTVSNLSTLEAVEVQKAIRGVTGRKGIRIEIDEPEPVEKQLFEKEYNKVSAAVGRIYEAAESAADDCFESYKLSEVFADCKSLRKFLVKLVTETQKFELALNDLEHAAHVSNGLVQPEE